MTASRIVDEIAVLEDQLSKTKAQLVQLKETEFTVNGALQVLRWLQRELNAEETAAQAQVAAAPPLAMVRRGRKRKEAPSE